MYAKYTKRERTKVTVQYVSSPSKTRSTFGEPARLSSTLKDALNAHSASPIPTPLGVNDCGDPSKIEYVHCTSHSFRPTNCALLARYCTIVKVTHWVRDATEMKEFDVDGCRELRYWQPFVLFRALTTADLSERPGADWQHSRRHCSEGKLETWGQLWHCAVVVAAKLLTSSCPFTAI